jgi:hypothetical protein
MTPASGVTKFIIVKEHTLLCYLSLTWMFNKPIFVTTKVAAKCYHLFHKPSV